jgi:hypothetical protein
MKKSLRSICLWPYLLMHSGCFRPVSADAKTRAQRDTTTETAEVRKRRAKQAGAPRVPSDRVATGLREWMHNLDATRRRCRQTHPPRRAG